MANGIQKDLGKVTAYSYAKAAGYTGTEEQFQAIFNEFTKNAPGLIDRMDTAVERAEAAVTNIDATVQDAVDDAVEEATASAVATANQAVTDAQAAQTAAEGAVTQANAAVTQANNAVTAAQAAQSAAEDAAESFVLDRTLTDPGAAAPADLVGDLKTAITRINDALDYTENEVYNTVGVDITRTLVPIVSNLTLEKGKTYQIKASIPSAVDKTIYISLRDSNNTILYSQKSTIEIGQTEKVFDLLYPTDNHTGASIQAYVYASSVTSITPIPITADLISVNDPSGYLTLNRINAINPSDEWRYLMFTVAGATASPSGMIILGSNNGVLFDVFKKMGCYVCKRTHTVNGETKPNTVRDPSVIKIGKYYYIIYTIIGWHQGSAFGMCRTTDFVTYEELPNVNLTDSSNNPFTRVWAPAWFQDGFNYYISVACEANSAFTMYLLDFDPDSCTVTGSYNTEIGTNDVHWYYSNGTYYALGNDALFSSNTLKSTSYTRIKSPRSGVEGDIAIRLDSGKYRVYAALINQQFEDVEIGTYVENDISNTTDISFSPIELTVEAQAYQTELGYKYTHPSVYDFYDSSITKSHIMLLEHEAYDA